LNKIFTWHILRWIPISLFVIFVAIQFVPVERSNPPVESEVPTPVNVRSILRRACYDCHSNETIWPWYSKIAPLSWLTARDVQEGRRVLNYSTWNQYDAKQQTKRLKESWEEVAEGEMPPWFYIAIHRDAVLSKEDRSTLRTWARGSASKTGKVSAK
jgi:hypothetical protein